MFRKKSIISKKQTNIIHIEPEFKDKKNYAYDTNEYKIVNQFYKLLNIKDVYGDVDNISIAKMAGRTNSLTFSQDSINQKILIAENSHAIVSSINGNEDELFGYDRIENKSTNDKYPNRYDVGEDTFEMKDRLFALVDTMPKEYMKNISFEYNFMNCDKNNNEIDLGIDVDDNYILDDWQGDGDLIEKNGKYYFNLTDERVALKIQFNRKA